MISSTAAENYFANHLIGALYLNASAADKSAALAMANTDIAAALDGVEPADSEPFAVAAVCEQVLYLLAGKDEFLKFRSDVESESVSGVGSQSFRPDADRTIAPRARRLLAWFAPAGLFRLQRA